MTRLAKFLIALSTISLSNFPLAADTTLLKQGEELFLQNRPEEARSVLESALVQSPDNEKIYLYLGTIYEQLGLYEDAVTILRRGTAYADLYLDDMYFNIGNNFFFLDKFILAEEMYEKAVVVNPDLTGAYLNRANTRLKLEYYQPALDDYYLYLKLEPGTPQRENIEQIIALLQNVIDLELAKTKDEEELRLAEQARQRALLNEVLSSLQKASEGTRSLSAESEGIEEVVEESDIVD